MAILEAKCLAGLPWGLQDLHTANSCLLGDCIRTLFGFIGLRYELCSGCRNLQEVFNITHLDDCWAPHPLDVHAQQLIFFGKIRLVRGPVPCYK